MVAKRGIPVGRAPKLPKYSAMSPTDVVEVIVGSKAGSGAGPNGPPRRSKALGTKAREELGGQGGTPQLTPNLRLMGCQVQRAFLGQGRGYGLQGGRGQFGGQE